MKRFGLIGAVLVFLLAGCGQKGPLYLPQPAKPSPDAPQTAPEPKPELKKESTGY